MDHALDQAQATAIGGILHRPTEAATVFTRVRVEDFDPPYRQIAEAIHGLRLEQKQVGPLPVIDEMTRRGTIGRVGGPAEVMRVSQLGFGSIDYACEVIARYARLRRLNALAGAAAAEATHPDADPHRLARIIMDGAQAVLDGIESEGDVIVPTLAEFLAGDDPEHDWVIPGLLERGDRLVLTGVEGGGKALALETPIATPTGWTTMGDIQIGDYVIDMDGKPTKVVDATDVMEGRPCYRITFSDGSVIIADEQHKWLTHTLRARECEARLRRRGATKPRGTDQRHKMTRPSIVTTKEIADTLRARDGHCLNHSIPTTAPLDLPEATLPIDPYTLGVWLGDGTTRSAQITTHPGDVEILDKIRSAGYTVTKLKSKYSWAISRREQYKRARAAADAAIAAGATQRAAEAANGIGRVVHNPVNRVISFQTELRDAGLLGNKHIPQTYLRASKEQRAELLRGLMDTDGTISTTGACEFSVCSERLARDFLELAHSLGIKATANESAAKLNGVEVGRRWRIKFYPAFNPFHLERKSARYVGVRTARAQHRYITSVVPIESVPVRCIQVDNDAHMYLAGESMIPTHNSVTQRQLAVAAAAGVHPFKHHRIEPARVLYVDCENGPIKMRRALRPLVEIGKRHGFDPGENMWVECVPQGIDLTKPEDEMWLVKLVTSIQPDLLITGPLYRLHAANPNDEQPAREVARVLDRCRSASNCALITEAHSGHGFGGDKRPVRPTGTSLWLRWPEFGYGLRPTDESTPQNRIVDFVPWRGDREARDWPRQLRQGTTAGWPWEAVPDRFDPTAGLA